MRLRRFSFVLGLLTAALTGLDAFETGRWFDLALAAVLVAGNLAGLLGRQGHLLTRTPVVQLCNAGLAFAQAWATLAAGKRGLPWAWALAGAFMVVAAAVAWRKERRTAGEPDKIAPPMKPLPERFAEVRRRLEEHVEKTYGLAIEVVDVPAPFKGDLDGASILLDPELTPEDAVFMIAHLFGHTAQWNRSEADRELGAKVVANPTETELDRLEIYEREAAAFGLQALVEIGAGDFAGWYSDYSAADFAYLEHFYKTGEKPPLESFWRDGTPPLAPLPVPPFTPHRWRTRADGIVV